MLSTSRLSSPNPEQSLRIIEDVIVPGGLPRSGADLGA